MFALQDLISDNIASYGPWFVWFLLMLSGIGLSVSEDLIIIPAGVLVGTGKLEFFPVLIAGYLGVMMSDALWFIICSKFGTPLLHKRWFKRMVHPRRLLQAKHQIEERGAWVLVMARFIPGSRTTTITVAGMLHMPLWKFLAITIACVLITCPMQIGIGLLIAHQLSDMETAQTVRWVIAIVVLGGALIIAVRIFRRHRETRERPPRAKVKWIKKYRGPHPARKNSHPTPE